MICCPYNAAKEETENNQQSTFWNHPSDFVGQVENCKERGKHLVRIVTEKQLEQQLSLAGDADFTQTSCVHCCQTQKQAWTVCDTDCVRTQPLMK